MLHAAAEIIWTVSVFVSLAILYGRLHSAESRIETLIKAHADLAARAAARERQEIAERDRNLAAFRKAVEGAYERGDL